VQSRARDGDYVWGAVEDSLTVQGLCWPECSIMKSKLWDMMFER
jgi:hypothetical protein